MNSSQIQIHGKDSANAANSLTQWINGNRILRGHVSRISTLIEDGQLGGVIDALEVALGAGGMGVALAQTLSSWIQNQRSDLLIRISRDGRSVCIDIKDVKDPHKVIRDVLRTDDED